MSFTGGRGRQGKALIIAGVIIWAAGLALVGGILRVGAQSRRRLARLVPQLLARLLASLHPHRREHPRRHDDRPGDQASEARSQLHRRPWSVDSAARARLPAARRPARTGLVPRPVGPVPAPLVGRPCLDPAHPVAPEGLSGETGGAPCRRPGLVADPTGETARNPGGWRPREPLGPVDSMGAPVDLALLAASLGGTTQV